MNFQVKASWKSIFKSVLQILPCQHINWILLYGPIYESLEEMFQCREFSVKSKIYNEYIHMIAGSFLFKI